MVRTEIDLFQILMLFVAIFKKIWLSSMHCQISQILPFLAEVTPARNIYKKQAEVELRFAQAEAVRLQFACDPSIFNLA